ncbi:MAG TPA: radical SAM protein [Longimicrobiales bacterium]|nr:radical SAM protein [Longimicrobiales bacterium]
MAVPLRVAGRAVLNYFARRPYCASFELTHDCNARCHHCHRGEPVPDERLASPQRLVQICRELRPVVAIMSGGEPLMRPELEEIVRLFKRDASPIRVFVNTNGFLLTRERFDTLKAAGVDEILISFDFPDERHDEWRAIPRLFRKIEGLIRGLPAADRQRVVLTGVLHSRNFRDAPRMADLALAWGVNINYSAYTWLRTNDMSLMIQRNEMDEFRRVIDTLIGMKLRHGHVLTSEWVLRGMIPFFLREDRCVCRAGERSLVVNPDGTLSPCGLLIRDFATREDLLRGFTRTNSCIACYTSTRANSERPARHIFLDHLAYLRRRAN